MDYVRLSNIDFKGSIGKRVDTVFIVKSFDIRPQKNGGEFMTLILKDKAVEKEAKIFSITDRVKQIVKEGLVYRGKLDISKYSRSPDGIGCILYSIESSEIMPEQLAEWNPYLGRASDIIGKALSMMREGIYKAIAYELLYTQWDKLVLWAGGKSRHHTELGSLLAHTAEVTDTAIQIGLVYKKVYGESFINMDLLIAGAMLHDIGKLNELSIDKASGNVSYTVDSVFKSHIITGLLEIHDCANKLGYNADSEEVKLLEHLILSHHGKLEYGSPVKPAVPEAAILHISDGISAEMWVYNREMSKMQGGEVHSSWSNGQISSVYKEVLKGINKKEIRDGVEEQCEEESIIMI